MGSGKGSRGRREGNPCLSRVVLVKTKTTTTKSEGQLDLK